MTTTAMAVGIGFCAVPAVAPVAAALILNVRESRRK